MKKVLIIILVVAALGVVGYLYVFHKPHRDVTAESADFEIKSTVLVEQYNSDRNNADSLYLDNVLKIKGLVKEIAEDHIVLDGGVVCQFLDPEEIKSLQSNVEVSIKGRLVSYDDLFGEVRMDNCHLAE